MRSALLIIALAAPLAMEKRLAANPGPDKPDIVFILIDTLRADHLGCYGYPLATSPTIDDIAARSVVFTDAVAPAPWTVPSVASIFTSVFPSRHGVLYHNPSARSRSAPHATNALADHFDTLAEQLKAAGYVNAAFIANPWIDRQFGYDQGFDHFQVIRKGGGYHPGNVVNGNVFKWLRANEGRRPVFLYIHYMDVHGPYDAPSEFRRIFVEPLRERARRGELTKRTASGRAMSPSSTREVDRTLCEFLEYWIARYDACVRFVDSHVAELRDGLRTLGTWDDAIIVITADHGQELAEHGGSAHGYNLFGHQLFVPLIIQLPNGAPPARIDATVSLLDLAPTLWELAGAETPPGATGRSLVPMMHDAARRRAAYAFAEGVRNDPSLASVQLGRRKLIFDATSREDAYYNLEVDPTEQTPSRLPPDEEFASLAAAMRRWLDEHRSGKPAEAPTTTIDPELERTLKSLGYLDDSDE